MKESDISTDVMEKIKSQNVTMRPRWNFTLLTVMSFVSVVLLSLVSIYLTDIVTLALRIEINDRPMFGARQRLSDLLTTFPWWLLALAVICIALLVWLLRRSGTLHRYSTGWIVAGVVALSLLIGISLSYVTPNPGPQNGQGNGGRNGQGVMQLK